MKEYKATPEGIPYYAKGCPSCQVRRLKANDYTKAWQKNNQEKVQKNKRVYDERRREKLASIKKLEEENLALRGSGAENRPEFIRVPKEGKRCGWTGLGHHTIIRLITPTEENSFNPPVLSICLTPDKPTPPEQTDSEAGFPGPNRGPRLVGLQSLLDYIWDKAEK